MIKKIGRFIKKNFLLILSAPLVLIILFTAVVKCSALSIPEYGVQMLEQNGFVTWNGTYKPAQHEPEYNYSSFTSSPSLCTFQIEYVIPADFIVISREEGPATPIFSDLQNISSYFQTRFSGVPIPGISVGSGLNYSLVSCSALDYYLFSGNFTGGRESPYLMDSYECQNGCLTLTLSVSYSCSPVLDISVYQTYYDDGKYIQFGNWFDSPSGEFINLFIPGVVNCGDFGFFIESSDYENACICYMRVVQTDIVAPGDIPIYSKNFGNTLYGRYLSSFDNYISSCIYYDLFDKTAYSRSPSYFFFTPLGFSPRELSASPSKLYPFFGRNFWKCFSVTGGSDFDFSFSSIRIYSDYYLPVTSTQNSTYYVACTVNKGLSAVSFPANIDIKITAFTYAFTDPAQTSFGVGSGTDTGYNFKDLYKTIDYDFKRDGVGPVFTRVLPYSLYNFCVWFVLESPLISDIIKPVFSVVNVTSTFARDYLLPIFTALGVFGGLLALVLVVSVIVKRLQ